MLHDLNRDALNAELEYRRELLTASARPARAHLRRARNRRIVRRSA